MMHTMTRIRKVVFPVGGLGTRFLPATKSMPKEMLPVVDKPLIHYAFEEARAAGIEQFIFVTGRNKSAIENHFDLVAELEAMPGGKRKSDVMAITSDWLPQPGTMTYLRQQQPLGLGHAVWCARHAVGNEPFAVILADDLVYGGVPCLKQMIEAYQAGANMAAVMDVPKEKTASYGILQAADTTGTIVKASGLVEKPKPEAAPSTLSIIGRYILQPGIFEVLEKQATGAGGEIQLTDAMAKLVGTQAFHAVTVDAVRHDCGDKYGFVLANLALALDDPEIGARVAEAARGFLPQE